MKHLLATTALALVVMTGQAGATPPIVAAAGAGALSSSQAGALAGAEATGVGTGVGTGGDASAGSTGSVKNESGDTVAAALGQAPSALSVEGVCGKDNRFAFGAIQWSDYSSKCFNYQLALIAAQTGNWTLANQWVERADGM